MMGAQQVAHFGAQPFVVTTDAVDERRLLGNRKVDRRIENAVDATMHLVVEIHITSC